MRRALNQLALLSETRSALGRMAASQDRPSGQAKLARHSAKPPAAHDTAGSYYARYQAAQTAEDRDRVIEDAESEVQSRKKGPGKNRIPPVVWAIGSDERDPQLVARDHGVSVRTVYRHRARVNAAQPFTGAAAA
jgi:hypothetical protein